jgi:two-component system nitrogen regulation response regulator GlnG
MEGGVVAAREIRRVLLVDDDEALRSAVARALRTNGRAIEAVGTVGAALEALARGFDLVLLDVRLPDGSGVRVAEAASAMQPSPLIVVVSG